MEEEKEGGREGWKEERDGTVKDNNVCVLGTSEFGLDYSFFFTLWQNYALAPISTKK